MFQNLEVLNASIKLKLYIIPGGGKLVGTGGFFATKNDLKVTA
jgi:hypothetical protein